MSHGSKQRVPQKERNHVKVKWLEPGWVKMFVLHEKKNYQKSPILRTPIFRRGLGGSKPGPWWCSACTTAYDQQLREHGSSRKAPSIQSTDLMGMLHVIENKNTQVVFQCQEDALSDPSKETAT